jgi:diguanylate cyclase (GGDEF)-like protein
MPGSCLAEGTLPGVRRLLLLAICCTAPAALALDPAKEIRQYMRADWQDTLPQATVLSIAQTRDGYLWIGTYAGLARFDGEEFTVFDRRNSPLETVAISALAEDPATGTLWVGTVGGGLYEYEHGALSSVPIGGLGETIYSLAAAAGDIWIGANHGLGVIHSGRLRIFSAADGVPPNRIRDIEPDAHGVVWIGTEGGGLLRYEGGRFTRYTRANGLTSDLVFALATDASGTLWIGTHDGGLNVFRNGAFGPALMNGSSIYALAVDHDDNVWMSREGAGICRLTAGRITCDTLTEADAQPDIIRSLRIDREGSLWIGGTNGGLHRLTDSKVTTALAEHSNNYVRSVFQDAGGTMWIGMDGDGLMTVRDGALVPFTARGKLPSGFVRAIFGDRDGNLWIGTLAGMARLRDGALTTFTTRDGLASDFVYAFAQDRSGALWIGTSAGLNRRVGEKIETIIPKIDVRALAQDRNGRMWVGKRDGLAIIDSGGRLESLPYTGSVFGFHEDVDGTMWVGTGAGIMRIRGARIAQYTARDGLLDDNAFAILDDAGNFWISSNKGIYRVARAQFEAFDQHRTRTVAITSFDKSDGMAATQCNGASQPSAWKSRDGRLWFATVRGVATVDPKRIRINRTIPPVVIERAAVDPRTRKVEIAYAALSLVAPQRVRYRYRLEGFDLQWIDAGARRAAFYTNLPPGDYTFRVIASNNDGVWNTAGASLPIAIEPRVYETWWFRTLVALLIVAVAVLIMRIRTLRLHARERELIALVEQRTEELERLTKIDSMTGVGNRRAFAETLDAMWRDHCRRGSALAVLVCDVDHFKLYNDRYGHPAGDEALIAIAHAITDSVRRAMDFVARYGGEEFAILLPDTSAAGAEVVANKIVEAVRALAIPHEASDAASVVTLSMGIASAEATTGGDPANLIRAADRALYQAKAEGRNRVRVTAAAVAAARA